jgi:hypothetical protein
VVNVHGTLSPDRTPELRAAAKDGRFGVLSLGVGGATGVAVMLLVGLAFVRSRSH